jgi:hypothetical protein
MAWPFARRGAVRRSLSRRIVVIGLDLGTSSVKAAYRDATDLKSLPMVVDFGTSLPGFSRFAFPSTIALAGNRIVTGVEAEQHRQRGVPTLLSVKRLALSDEFANPTYFADVLCEHLAGSTPDEVHEFAMATLSAHALQRTLACVLQGQHGQRETYLVFNIDVPMSKQSDPRSERFLRVLRTAVALATDGDLPSSAARLHERWLRARDEQAGDRELCTRTEQVPEAEAVMAGLSGLVPQPEGVPHAVVDIGSGTTDVGIFRFSEWRSIDQIVFFATGTQEVGVDDLDHSICASSGVGRDEIQTLVQVLRAGRADLARGQPLKCQIRGRPVSVSQDVIAECCRAVGKCVRDHYADQWRTAYKKIPNQDNWRDLRVLAVGGGSLLPPLFDALAELPPGMNQTVTRFERLRLEPRAMIGAIGESHNAPTRAELVFLAAALGLSYASPQRRQLIRPHEIEPWDRPPGGATGPYADEIDLYE